MGVNENRQSGLDEAIQVGSAAAKVVEGAAKAGKITAAAANGAALGGPYGAAASVAIAAAKHGKNILLALLAILAIPLLFLVMLPTLIFGGTAQNSGDTTILNDQTAITENMNEIAFAVSDLLGSGIADAEQRIADDFAASSADQYEIVNPYEDERINNVNLFISQYCAYRDTDVAAISLEDMKQLLRSGIGELYDYTYEDETREIEEIVLNEDGEEVTELREVTVRVYTLTYRGEAYFADSIFHLTVEQKTLAQNFAENLSLFLGDGLFQNLSSSESSFTIPALGNIRYTDGGTEVVYYNQLDERYANKPYGTDDIGGYGCGPTCMAMVVSSLTDDLVDPVEMAKWSYEHGYRRIDNLDIARVVLPIIGEMEGARFESCEITDDRMYLKVVNPRLQAEVVPGDIVQAGIMISNSETGLGAVNIQPLIYRLVCSNGMVVNEAGTRRAHIGRVNTTDVNFTLYSQQTLNAEDHLFVLKIQDTVRAAVDEARFSTVLERMRESKQAQLNTQDLPGLVKLTGSSFGILEEEGKGILQHLIEDGDFTLYGLANAVTRFSQDVESYDRATKLEEIGYSVMTMSPLLFQKINQTQVRKADRTRLDSYVCGSVRVGAAPRRDHSNRRLRRKVL